MKATFLERSSTIDFGTDVEVLCLSQDDNTGDNFLLISLNNTSQGLFYVEAIVRRKLTVADYVVTFSLFRHPSGLRLLNKIHSL